MTEIIVGTVVSIAVRVANKAGQALPQEGTVVAIHAGKVTVLLPTGDLWYGTLGQVYPWQDTQ